MFTGEQEQTEADGHAFVFVLPTSWEHLKALWRQANGICGNQLVSDVSPPAAETPRGSETQEPPCRAADSQSQFGLVQVANCKDYNHLSAQYP